MFVSPESGHVPSTTAPAPMPSYCLTSNGHRYEEGDGWHDGCRDCYCHSGREMCVLISCPVPSCAHPVVRPDQCCPTCEGTSLNYVQLKSRWNGKYLLTFFSHIPGHIVLLSDHVGMFLFVFSYQSRPKSHQVVTLLTAGSTNQFQPLISQHSPSSSYNFSPREPRRLSS